MVGHGGGSAGSYLADPTSPIPSHCASIVVTSTLRVKLSGSNSFGQTSKCLSVRVASRRLVNTHSICYSENGCRDMVHVIRLQVCKTGVSAIAR